MYCGIISLSMSKKPSPRTKPKKKLNLLDWAFIAIGLIVSVYILIFYHENPPLYTIVSVIALNGGIIGTVLSIKGYKINFIFSFIESFACGYTSQVNHFFGNAVINIFFYAPCMILGYFLWGKHQSKDKKVIARKLTPVQIAISIVIFIVATAVLNLILTTFDGNQTILDSSGTVLVAFATILSILRYRETWLVWLLCDILQLLLWTTTNDPALLTLRIFFPISALYGYIYWKKLLKK